MSVVECQTDATQGKVTSAMTIPAGTMLTTKRTVEGQSCRFRTAYPVELWPFAVSECEWRLPERLERPVRMAGAAAVLRVRLECGPDASFEELDLSALRLYLAGETNVVHTLYELLCGNCIGILVRNPEESGGAVASTGAGTGAGKVASIGCDQLAAMGFAEEESLLPYPRRSFDGYRLLQEYFTFPEKFLFFRLGGT